MTAPAEPRPALAPPKKLGRKLFAGVLFGAACYLAYVLWADVGRMREALADFPWSLLAIACGLSFTNYVVRFARWQRYLSRLDIRLDLRTSFTIYLAGLALTVTPGKMGETFKSWLIRRVDGTPIAKSAPIVIAERFTDLLGFLILIAVGGLATEPEYAWIFWATLALCAAMLIAAGSARFERMLVRVLERLPLLDRLAPAVEAAFESTRKLLAPRELVMPTLVSALGWGLECTAFWLIADALTEGVPFLYATYTFALAAVAGAVLIVFPGGLGVTEASMGALLERAYVALGVTAEAARSQAASATILIRLCTLWFAVAVGWLALAAFTRRHGSATQEGTPT